ncbi:cytochrome P450 6a8-like [Armigeres subalbatus]|uniref:cytochrome P450 6a8-like n=1 Tax=Armigeres subalbatus TaxID=124917 RepID=UPI002ED632CB
MLSLVFAIVALLLTAAALYIHRRGRFWSDRGIPCAPNPEFLFGHVRDQLTKRHASYVHQDLYRQFKARGESFAGYSFFSVPAIMTVDPELVKTILVRDFGIFHDRGIFNNPKDDPLSGHLFLLEGLQWKVLRQMLSPTFTSGRMKMMFGAIMEVAEKFRQFMVENRGREPVIEMKEVLAMFTTDVIGTCAFGIECNTLNNPDSDFLKYGKMVFEQKLSIMAKFIFASLFKDLGRALGIKLVEADLENFFMGLVRETVEFREKNNVQRNDFMNLLLQLKNKGRLLDQLDEGELIESRGLTMDELAAQCFVFFIAGFETSSTTMNFCLYELAKNPDIQEKLRVEIEKAIASNDGQVTYDLVMGHRYLDNVVNETLRKYPPLESLNRVPISDYTVPGTQHVLPKQTMITIPVYAMHHDPEYYPDPERFDPDRFIPEAVQARHPYTFIPFGEGPRNCIGMRFGVMQTKIGLITLLRNFRFSPSSKTPERLVFEVKSFVLSPKGGNYLKFDKI